MSLRLLAESHVELIALNTDHFAETVRRFAEGVRKPVSLSALVTWETSQVMNTIGKREAKLKALLTVAADDALSVSDRWEIDGRMYATTAVDPAQNGTQTVTIEQRRGDLRGDSLGVI